MRWRDAVRFGLVFVLFRTASTLAHLVTGRDYSNQGDLILACFCVLSMTLRDKEPSA